MVDMILNYILTFQWNSWLAIGLYWVPLSFCVYGYTARTIKRYVSDKKERETPGAFYYPRETVGCLIGRALVTILPIANLWAALFDLAPKIFSEFFTLIGKIFDQPLVPDTKYHYDLRKKENKNG